MAVLRVKDKNVDKLLRKICLILSGIDKTEIAYFHGWWQTVEGAEFGKRKLESVKKAFADFKENL